MGAESEHARDIAWSRQTFRLMAEGGTWGVPNSGLIFQKQGGELVLISKLSYQGERPVTPDEVEEEQEKSYELIRRMFGEAGITVRKA